MCVALQSCFFWNWRGEIERNGGHRHCCNCRAVCVCARCRDLPRAVNQLCSHFEAYKDIPKVTELREKFKNIKQILKSHVFSDFSSLGTGKESEESNLLQQLADACLVVDALEPSVREEVVQNFCSRELTSYQQIFEGAELAKLDKTERRYGWIKRRLRTNEEIWKIFPPSWHVPYLLCIQFCKLTRYFPSSSLLLVECRRELDCD
ncbi:hypothetical protein ACSBR2_039505 [Camellia fascicularis]